MRTERRVSEHRRAGATDERRPGERSDPEANLGSDPVTTTEMEQPPAPPNTAAAQDSAKAAPREKRSRASRTRYRLLVTGTQVAILVAALLIWANVWRLQSIFPDARFLDPYFTSSPAATYRALVNIVTGSKGAPFVWDFAKPTFASSVIGTVVGLAAGGFVGLILSSFRFLSDVLRPFLVALNAIPRIALIPVIVVVFGTGGFSSVVIAVMVVFFVGVFNAYEGGRTVEPQFLQNAKLLGAGPLQLMWRVRAPFALAWTLASLPVAVSFAIISVVTGEILTGATGMGQLINQATSSSNVSLTFAVIIVLSALALIILGAAEVIKRRVLHWWVPSDG